MKVDTTTCQHVYLQLNMLWDTGLEVGKPVCIHCGQGKPHDDDNFKLHATQYRIGPADKMDPACIEVRYGQFKGGTERWVVKQGGAVLNRSLEWEFESIPSSRTEDFIARTRFDTVEEALETFKSAGGSRFKHYDQPVKTRGP